MHHLRILVLNDDMVVVCPTLCSVQNALQERVVKGCVVDGDPSVESSTYSQLQLSSISTSFIIMRKCSDPMRTPAMRRYKVQVAL